ncbi:hypothetical protein [Rhizobium grahamii]|uniref:hypothetical protein n=1 Tax=Rhizobium grahamii TaxID=1120045 RepID=UPI001FCA9CDC|nr:hypothetical protein [Rhizobium grahamii]
MTDDASSCDAPMYRLERGDAVSITLFWARSSMVLPQCDPWTPFPEESKERHWLFLQAKSDDLREGRTFPDNPVDFDVRMPARGAPFRDERLLGSLLFFDKPLTLLAQNAMKLNCPTDEVGDHG